MASVKVAVRVRPLNKREVDLQSQTIIHMKDKLTSITNVKVSDGIMGDSTREKVKEFTFDHSYWSACRDNSHYVAQKQVFMDLGLDVVDSAYRGYNACVFAYGQTGSGKTYTMMGNPDDVGLIPRIGKELFDKMSDTNTTYRTEVSYLEIYNEKVRDLLKTKKQQHTLRVREHPKDGPYVEGLSKHIVMNFSDIKELMDKGNASRTTAATNMNDVSSRSHAIFTVLFTQAKFSKDAPSEMHSKIHLVDLAGSERADQSGATGQRLKEGGSINKSLVTLGNVISALADMSEREHHRRSMFIPYRDSVLTWLLKDSLGGNSKTIMVATISPASCNYAESLSTLRYANRAKNIINKPTVNEDSNVKLIRELREEIARLRTLLGGHIDNIVTPKVQEKLHENEARVKVLTDEWTGKWKEMANILKEERNLELRKSGLGVVLDSELPHLIGIDDDILSTGIMLYHLKDCHTMIGTADAPKQQDIVLSGVDMEPEHCIIEHNNGDVTLVPLGTAACTVNGIAVSGPTKLNQGAVILLGKTNMFRFNHPAEAAKLRAEFKTTRTLSMSRASLLSQSMSDLYRSTENLALMTTGWEMEENHKELLVALDDKRRQVEEMEERLRRTEVDRLQEQGAAELELDERRRMLERLQHEAEMMKAEAQQTQREAVEEVTRLKSRISDVESQLDRQQELNDVSTQENGSGQSNGQCPSLLKAVAKLRQAINDEITSLAEKENQAKENAQTTKQKLSAELAEVKAQHKGRTRALEEDAHKLEEKKNQLLAAVEEAEMEVKEKKDSLEQLKEQDLGNIERSRKHLESLKNDHNLFEKLSSELDTTTQDVLIGQYDQLTAKQRSVKGQEKDMYEIYKREEAEILGRKTKTQEEIVDEQKQLDADEIYLAECSEKLRLASESDMSREQRQKEQAGLEKEQTRIKEDKKRLLTKKEEMAATFKTAMAKLQQMRTQQIETLNETRDDMKELTKNWVTLLDGEISKVRDEFAETQLEIEEKEKMVAEAVTSCEAAKTKWNDERGILEKESDWLNDVICKWRRHSEQAAVEIERRTADVDEESNGDLRRITNHRNILDELAFVEHVELTEEELEDKQQAFDRYKKLKEEELLEHSCKLRERQVALQLQHQTQLEDLAEERSQIEHRLQSLQSIEEQLRQRETDLRERQQLHGQERQQQLDDLDLEKFRLRELEEQERINVLVEQEVKRRMFERRVRKEKEQQVDLERERADHAQELARIRNEHRREMQRLRQRYETSTPENVRTTANPYASLQNGNVESRPSSSARQLSLDMVSEAGLSSLLQPIQVWIPSYVHCGSGFDVHFEFEVKFTVMCDVWTVFRRYSNFRELHNDLKARYPEVAALSFPPKRWFGNRLERIVSERRSHLEDYLQNMLNVLVWNTGCPLHPSYNKVYSKQVLYTFHPFFKKGLFETGRHSTS